MAESFLFNIAERVVEKLVNLSVQEVCLPFNVKSDLRKLKETTILIKAVILDAERQQQQSEKLRLCMWKLKDIFHDAEDVIDDFKCEALRKRVANHPNFSFKVRFLSSCSVPLAFSFKMGHKIKEINRRLGELATEWNSFNLGHGTDVFHRETHSFVNSSDVIGYNRLPPHLQRCLAFLSLFKKDHIYDSRHVIQLWMANGLLEHPKEKQEWEEVGDRYLNELLSRCLIQMEEEFDWYFIFKMHDRIHDLVSDVSRKECKLVTCQTETVGENVRHLLFCDDKLLEVPQVLKKLKRAGTVIVQQVSEESKTSIHESLINLCASNFKYLRALSLRGSELTALPNSIGILKHLRDLDLTFCYNIQKLPSSFYKLRSLQTLRMLNIPLMQLPDSVLSMIELRYLEITIKAKHMKEIRPGCWPSLQYLGLFHCYELECLSEGMQHLTSLRRLDLVGCSNLVSLPRSLKFLSKLEELSIFGCGKINLEMEPEEKQDNDLPLSLEIFTLFSLDALTDLPRLLLEGSSSTLQQIRIENCRNFAELPTWLQNRISPHKLVINDCPKLSALPQGVNRLRGAFAKTGVWLNPMQWRTNP